MDTAFSLENSDGILKLQRWKFGKLQRLNDLTNIQVLLIGSEKSIRIAII
jgi:hypothetical protein